MWIPLTLLLLNRSVQGVTRLVALVLAVRMLSSSTSKTPSPVPAPAPTSTPLYMLAIFEFNLHDAPTKSRNVVSPSMMLVSTTAVWQLARSRNRRRQEVGVLLPDVFVVAVPPALQSVFHRTCSAYQQLCRCQGVPDQAGQHRVW
jgi:hypothetical protein